MVARYMSPSSTMGSANLSGAVLVNDTVTKAETFGGLNRATMAVGFPTVQALHAAVAALCGASTASANIAPRRFAAIFRRACEFT